MNPTKILIIGGGYAGTMAAIRLAGKTKRANVEVTLINGLPYFVERIRNHQRAGGQRLKQHPFSRILKGTPINFRQAWVTGIHPDEKKVTAQAEDRTLKLDYDYLVYALGSSTDTESVPGIKEHALTLDFTKSAQIAERLDGAKRVVVCGGGLTGIEAATELAESRPDLDVSLITRETFAASFSAKGQAYLRKTFARLGITIHEQSEITAIEPNAVIRADQPPITSDLSIWAGAFSVPKLAAETGLKVNGRGQVLVDEYFRSASHPTILVVGDGAMPVGMSLRMGCVTAMPMAAHAADYLVAVTTNATLPDPFSFGYMIQCVSLGRRDGIVQWVHPDDSPREAITTGWLGARIKAFICRYAFSSLYLEKRFPGLYRWPTTPAEAKGKPRAVGQHHV